jgi:soluble lytic murein transglycosylase-like protein/outer membrane protein assembly factor BamD (BamD/ComL family)
MKTLSARFIVVLFLIVSSLFTVSVLVSSPQPAASLIVRPESAEQQAWRQHHPTLPENLYAQAAEALRHGNLQEARQHLDSIASQHPDQAAQTRVLAGLYAHQAGDDRQAEELLAGSSAPDSSLEDWRLYLLAKSAARRGDQDLARGTYDHLLADHPESPLRPAAFLEAAQLAADHGQPQAALDLVRRARKAGVETEDIDRLAWKVGRQVADEGEQREAGRRLLIEDPLSSTAAQVVHVFRAPDGAVDWSHLLSPQEVLRRAQSFLAGHDSRAALLTLDQVPDESRDFQWHLTRARSLLRGGDGHDALTVLSTLMPSDSEERAQLEWERVLAMAEAGQADAASVSLAKLVRTHAKLQLSADALRRLYKDFQKAGLTEPAVDTLRLLRRVDSLDETGASDLWERGWLSYQAGDRAAAVASWSVLGDLYPEDGDAQRGRYWQARALEEMGQREEAHALFRQIVASSDTSDFYARQALAGLGETAAPASAEMLSQAQPGAWPAEPVLRRAKLLTDLGLDDLASQELELVAARASSRDVLALKGLILCHKGDQRTGLVLLREAYPALGGPSQANVPAEVLFAYYPLTFGDQIRECARETGLPGHLIAGIIRQESAFDPRATSPVGARGLMQLMPDTAREMSHKVGVPYAPERLYDPNMSVRLGSVYFKELLDRFDGNVELALASYNGGPNRIQRLWTEKGPDAQLADFLETLNIDESRNYVKRILVLADSYRQLYPSLG